MPRGRVRVEGMSVAPAAFGFRIAGAPGVPWLAVRDCEDWPLLTFERDPELPETAGVRVEASSLRATVPGSWSDENILHPGLALAALALAAARGVDSLHAGAVLGPEGAWAPPDGAWANALGATTANAAINTAMRVVRALMLSPVPTR